MRLFQTQRKQRGISLIEAMVYMTCVLIVMSVSGVMMWKLWDYHVNLNRRSEVLSRVLNIGEMWRDDVRRSASQKTGRAENEDAFFLGTKKQMTSQYLLKSNQVWRTSGERAELLLDHVSDSKIQEHERDGVIYWSWELAIWPGKQSGEVQRFTFMAVPQKKGGSI